MRTARANALRAASRLCVLGLLAGLVGAGQITPVEAHPRDGGGGIVFISDRDSTATTVIDDVYLLDPASGITRRLTNGPDIESMPALSPDGETLAFTSIPVSEDGFLNLAGAELRTCRFHTRYGRLGCGSTRTVLPAGGYASMSPPARSRGRLTARPSCTRDTTGRPTPPMSTSSPWMPGDAGRRWT